MKVRGPFQLPNRPTWYIDIGRKRKSLGTTDEAEAKRMVKDITHLLQSPSGREDLRGFFAFGRYHVVFVTRLDHQRGTRLPVLTAFRRGGFFRLNERGYGRHEVPPALVALPYRAEAYKIR